MISTTTPSQASMSSTQSPATLATAMISSDGILQPTTIASPAPTTGCNHDNSISTKLLIPIIVGTFLFSAFLTLSIVYLILRNRRRHTSVTQLRSPQTPYTPFMQSPNHSYAASPMSPDDVGRRFRKEGHPRLVRVQEATSGRKTPQEVLGDTTWGKEDMSPNLNRVSQFSGSPVSPRSMRR